MIPAPRSHPAGMPAPPSPDLPARGFAGRGLACRRGERLVFAGLSFIVPPGGALALTGPNGSGKSSLLRLMAGLTPPETGVLAWDRRPPPPHPPPHPPRPPFLRP